MPFAASLVPDFGGTVHVVLNDFEKAGRAYRETAESDASFASVLDDLLTGQFNAPVGVVAFNAAEARASRVAHSCAFRQRRDLIHINCLLKLHG